MFISTIIHSKWEIVNRRVKFRCGLCLLHANGELGWYLSARNVRDPLGDGWIEDGEIPTQLKSAKTKTKCAHTRISLDKKRYRSIIEPSPRCSGWLSPGFTSIHASSLGSDKIRR